MLRPMNQLRPTAVPIRELVIFAVCLLAGVAGLPALAFVIGQLVLGPYAGGGVGAIIANEFRGLGAAAWSSWVIALAPYGIVMLVRAIWNCDRLHTTLWPPVPRLDPTRRKDRAKHEEPTISDTSVFHAKSGSDRSAR